MTIDVATVSAMGVAAIIFSAAIGVAAHDDGRVRGQAIICAEIDWHSPTCEKIKKERLTP